MLDSVGPSSVQNLGRPENTVVAQEKKALIEKEQKVREDRPIESAQDSAELSKKTAAEEEEAKKNSAHTFEEGRVIYEKYNNNGDLIFRLPPAKKPVDEMV
ncbi:MAG: hypothetical protein QNJ22_03690 [Desulfosarcinaceae bacterium]|nr:hypothetical protein [Desulfosarcinaceae bacterium]